MAALLEQDLGVRHLEIAAPDLGRGNLRRDGQHRHPRAVAIEQAVDQMQVTGPAASCADRELASQMSFGAGCECSHLLVAHMDPLNLAPTSNCIGEAVKAVADNSVDSLDSGGRKCGSKLICNGPGHLASSIVRRGLISHDLAPATIPHPGERACVDGVEWHVDPQAA